MYDGRETDAWACGVVLFALATRKLPFDAQPSDGQPVDGPRARRKLLMRIAGGEYSWPCEEDGLPGDEETDDVTDLLHPAPVLRRGPALAASKGVREVVSRLLVRDPTKRASMSALWEESWMWGPGAPVAPVSASRSGSLSRKGSGVVRRRSRLERRRAATVAATDAPSRQNSKREKSSLGLELAGFPEPERTFSLPVELLPVVVTDDAGHYVEAITDDGTLVPDSILDGEEDVEEVEVEEHGALVDGDHIGDIARQELR
jgi:serine/threonine protein kinase